MNTQQTNIKETNVLIAEFLELDKISSNVLKKALLSDLDYHLSFDSLMPAVEKIESLGYDFNILTPTVIDVNKDGKTFIFLDGNRSKIEAVYNAVIEFIKWYNENSAKKE